MKKLAIYGGKPIRKEFLIFGNPLIKDEEINEVVETLKSGWISTGPKVDKFENMFKEYIGCKHAKALNSCTAGLHLAMLTSGIKPGDEVVTTPLTFAATVNSIVHTGAIPIFVDVNRKTMNIDPDLIKDKITEKTKAILPVHIAGMPCDMDKINKIAKENNLIVIEDAAHALEAKYKGKKIGNISDLTCFSFYVTKNLCTGEGGMATTNNDEYAGKIEKYALHGLSGGAWKRYSDKGFKHYEVIFPGYKYNMMDIQAAMGIHQLKRIEENLQIRTTIWKKYNEAFKDLSIITPYDSDEVKHARHLYPVLLDIDNLNFDRDFFQKALYKENIGTSIHFISLHMHKYYKERFNYKKEDFPNAAWISDRTLSLPFSAKLTEKDVDDVIIAVKNIINLSK